MAGIAALAMAYVLSQFFRSFLAVLTPVLSAELGMTKSDFAQATGLWFLAFALMQFAVGVSLDRHGPRRTASWMLGGLGALGGAVFALAQSPGMVIAAMVLIGMGCAPILMASFFIFAKTQPPARFATLSAAFIAFGTAGSVLGSSPLAHAIDAFGWRAVMAGLTLVTLAVAIAINRLIVDPEPDTASASSGLGGYVELMKMRVLWPIIPLVFVAYAVLGGVRGLWAGPFMADLHGADAIAIGNVTFAMAIAMVLATLAVGPLDRVFGTRKWVAVGLNAVMLFAVVMIARDLASVTPSMSMATATVWLVVIAIFGSGFPVMAAHARGHYPPHLVGRGVTLMNFFSIGGTGVMQFVTGGIVSSGIHKGDPQSQYFALFAFYAIALGVTLFIYLFSRDTKPG